MNTYPWNYRPAGEYRCWTGGWPDSPKQIESHSNCPISSADNLESKVLPETWELFAKWSCTFLTRVVQTKKKLPRLSKAQGIVVTINEVFQI